MSTPRSGSQLVFGLFDLGGGLFGWSGGVFVRLISSLVPLGKLVSVVNIFGFLFCWFLFLFSLIFLVDFWYFLLCHSCSQDPLYPPPASSPLLGWGTSVGGSERSRRGGLAGSHSALDPASGPPGPPGVCAAASLQVEDDEDEEDEESPGDLLEMEAATAAAAAETRPTPGGALSRGSPA